MCTPLTKITNMYEESVITPSNAVNEVFYIVPSAAEDQFVDVDCDTGRYEYARLDIMLEIINGYKAMPAGGAAFQTEGFKYERSDMPAGALARVTPLKAISTL